MGIRFFFLLREELQQMLIFQKGSNKQRCAESLCFTRDKNSMFRHKLHRGPINNAQMSAFLSTPYSQILSKNNPTRENKQEEMLSEKFQSQQICTVCCHGARRQHMHRSTEGNHKKKHPSGIWFDFTLESVKSPALVSLQANICG